MKTLQHLLQDLHNQPRLENYALVFSADLRSRLEATQDEQKNLRHKVKPVALTDGRWMLCADVLKEVGPMGLYGAGFSRLDPSFFSQVEILPFEEAFALLPKNEEQK